MRKRACAFLLLLAISISALFACSDEQTFSYLELSLVLTDDFEELESDSYDFAASDGEASVGVVRISLQNSVQQGISDTFSPRDFAEYALAESGAEADVYMRGDVPYYSDYKTVSGEEFYTLFTFYKSLYAYFIVVYAAPRVAENERREEFFSYAASAYFTA